MQQFPMTLQNFPMQPNFMMQFQPPQFNPGQNGFSGSGQAGVGQGGVGQGGVGQAGVGQAGVGQGGIGQGGFGQSGFGQGGFGQGGFGQPGFGQGGAYYGAAPQYSGAYYPVGSSGFALGGGDALCFTADTIVTTMNGQKKRMDELSVNDWVLSAGEKAVGYSKVNSWAHRKPNFMAEFIKFTLKNGKELKMTKKHYIYKSDCSNYGSMISVEEASKEMVYAENVSISDCLFIVQRNTKIIESRILKIEKIQERGIYSPMTNNGNIIVNDIFASCYNIVKNEKLQSSLPSFSAKIKQILSTLYYQILSNDYNISKTEVDLIPVINLSA
uniref:Hint domain-containing protein n=1 Tax=Panagrolaimus sp. PS1159 TaxID=55785 RepID=A0AC35FUP6_9BILA